jgi:hypothetical protein
MNRRTVLPALLVIAVSAGLFQLQQSRAEGQSSGASQDTVKIVALSPETDRPLRVGDKVTFRVKATYKLASAGAASVTLVIQRGESGNLPLANETQVIAKGAGTVEFVKELQIPDTAALQLFTPLSVQGSASTHVVDSRVYKVTKG